MRWSMLRGMDQWMSTIGQQVDQYGEQRAPSRQYTVSGCVYLCARVCVYVCDVLWENRTLRKENLLLLSIPEIQITTVIYLYTSRTLH